MNPRLILVLAVAACVQAREDPPDAARPMPDAGSDATPSVVRTEPMPGPMDAPVDAPRDAAPPPVDVPRDVAPPVDAPVTPDTQPACAICYGTCKAGHCQGLWDLSTWDQTEWAP